MFESFAFETQENSHKLRSSEYDDDDNEEGESRHERSEKKEAAERLKKYNDNTATKLHDELKFPDTYMDKITKTINLSDLYEIVDYYYISETQKFCPVLLKIKHDEIKRQENHIEKEEFYRQKSKEEIE